MSVLSRAPSRSAQWVGKSGCASPKTAFLIRSLEYGGAQRQLVTLARGLHERGHAVVVVVWYPDSGPLEEELRCAGVPVWGIGKSGRWDIVGFYRRLIRVLRRERPEVLHSYLDLPNLVALTLKPLFPRIWLVWGLRASDKDLYGYDWLNRASARLVPMLGRFPDLIIANSEAGGEHYRKQGVPAGKIRVIPNGIDIDRFAPDAAARSRVRAEWGISDRELLIGRVGRLDPMKDYPTFLRAAVLLAREHLQVRFVCVGNGPPQLREELEQLSRSLGLGDRLLWSDARADVSAVYNALDLLCSSSAFGEGFSNVIGEAMACEIPCVATDVGDAALVVRDTGLIVPPGDPVALAGAIQTLLSDPQREQRREAARQRILDHFSVERLLERTEEALWPRA